MIKLGYEELDVLITGVAGQTLVLQSSSDLRNWQLVRTITLQLPEIRVRAGIHELGLLKTVLAARQIYETNPYAQVTLFHAGLTPENLDDFLRGEPTATRTAGVIHPCSME